MKKIFDDKLTKRLHLRQKRWKPKKGEKYYVINGHMNSLYVYHRIYYADSTDGSFLIKNNVFELRSEAESIMKKIQNLLKKGK